MDSGKSYCSIARVDLTATNQNGNSTLYLIKSDYISLQDVTLSYQLPDAFAKQAGLSGLKVYAQETTCICGLKEKDMIRELL
jgi:hypothetical protein